MKRPAPLPAWRNSSSTPCSGNNTYYSLFSIAMLSRNQIRQAALQYLYAASQTPETEQEGIWDILMEPFRETTANSRPRPSPAT
ncbi:hypothetical protein M5E88_04020 [Akkermansia muciniphila]|nr:hypothetical protein M5E88_04020 [Akkermansia muciniphila]